MIWAVLFGASLFTQRATVPEFVAGDQCLFCHRNRFRSTCGTVFDHVAFSVDNLDPLLAVLSKGHVKILQAPKKIKGTRQRSVIVEGPDMLAVEMVEGHPSK